MNTNDIRISKTIPAPKETVFNYLTKPELIEQWSYPEGLTLKVPKFEANMGGRYRYEHTGKDGVFICEGKITAFVPNEKIVQLDEFINAPDGKRLAENLENTITLKDAVGGTEVAVVTTGNFDEKFLTECKAGWTQSFDHLVDLIAKDTRPGIQSKTGESRPEI